MSLTNVPVPTLTEVVQVDADVPQTVAAALAAIDEHQLEQRVFGELKRQVDLMLEYRLREALAPAMARLSNALIEECRIELASTLRDVVARAVSQELARQRVR